MLMGKQKSTVHNYMLNSEKMEESELSKLTNPPSIYFSLKRSELWMTSFFLSVSNKKDKLILNVCSLPPLDLPL